MNLNLPEIPAWLVAGLGGIWAALVLWQLFGRKVIDTSRDRARMARVTGTGEEVSVAPTGGLAAELEQAGLDMSPATFNALRLAGVVAGPVLAAALGLPPLLGIGLAGAAWWGSRAWVRGRIAGQGKAIEKELPTALSRIAALVDVEKDMPSLLMTVAEGLEAVNPVSPLAKEFRRTASELRSRGPVALADLEARSPSPALATVAFNLRTFLESGGEQSHLMAESAERMQKLIEGRNLARAKAAGALTVAKMFPGLLLFVSIFTFQDPTYRAVYTSLIGQIFLLAVAGIMAFGYFFIKGMVESVA
jgi:Flp pilus assembly protein TadB